VTASITLDRPAYALWRDGSGEVARIDFWIRLMERLRAAPGVDFVAAGSAVPTAGGGGPGFLEVEGLGQVDVGAGYRSVSADYFEVMGIPMVAGRTFDRRDGPDTERVVIVNRALADRFWPEGDALGRRVRALSMEDFGGGAPWLTVVGVVGDVRHFGFDDEPEPEMFTLHEQQPYWSGSMTLLARSGDRRTTGIPAAIRQAVHETDPSIPVTVIPLEDRVAGWVSDRMFVTSLLGAFGTLALLLAAIGLYGLLAFTVAGRTREIGIRAALGAGRSSVVSLVVRQSLVVTGLGIAAGVLAALALGGTLESMLVEVGPTDPITLGVAPLLLLVVAVAAAAIPAWRAARIDPLEALRSE
jgi:putative ABC transport system permease protein